MVDAEQRRDDRLLHQYEQVCISYRAIEDFRGKLLALWPILGGAAGGIAFLASREASRSYLWAVSLFGFFVSVGLAVYEWNQTLRCDMLKKAGRRLEREMRFEVGEGQFLSIPRGFKPSASGPPVQRLTELIELEEQETRWECQPGFWKSIRSIRRSPISVGLASLIVYGSVIAGWVALLCVGFLRLF